MKTNLQLVDYVLKKAAKPKTIYVLGAFGQNFTTAFLNQKCEQLEWNQENKGFLSKFVNQGYQAFDCVGLIKCFLWDDNPLNYVASQDENEVMMYERAKIKGNISSMPETPGILVYMPGHVGVYIGNGYVVECTPNEYLGGWGVLKTKFKGRGWTKWSEYTRIEYVKEKVDNYVCTVEYINASGNIKYINVYKSDKLENTGCHGRCTQILTIGSPERNVCNLIVDGRASQKHDVKKKGDKILCRKV